MTSEPVLHDRYRLLRKLGSGGMGSVWLAEDLWLKRQVALKELLHRHGPNVERDRKRALREAQAMAQLNHPSVVRIHDVFLESEDPWLVMEYIKGRSLEEIIRDGPLDERAIAKIALPVLHGLRAVHAAGMLHRDVKPGNIVVAGDESFLVDFGIARIDGDAQITDYSKILGTTEFMAPERIMGHAAGPPSDLWSLGVTLYCALEGYSPFLRRQIETQEATAWVIVHDDPPRPARQGRLAEVVLQLLHKDPLKRASAPQLTEVLQAICAATPTAESQPRAQQVTTRRQIGPVTRHSQTALAGPALDDAREAVRNASPGYGVGILLAMSSENAAQVVVGLRPREAGAIIQAIAASKPHLAGAILTMLSSSAAGRAVDFVSPVAAASVVASISPRDAAGILGKSDPRAAAEVLMELSAVVAARLLASTPTTRSATVLGYVRPPKVAAVFRVSADLRYKLLDQLSPAFQGQVRRYL